MEDIELQLKTLLQENWSVKTEEVIFHRNMRRVEGSLTQPNIIIRDGTDINKWDKEGMAECLALVLIRTRISAHGTTNEEIEIAKALKHEIREEIYRILKIANDTDDNSIKKPDGWEWAIVTRRINGDNFDAPLALLGEDLNITICYQRV